MKLSRREIWGIWHDRNVRASIGMTLLVGDPFPLGIELPTVKAQTGMTEYLKKQGVISHK